MSLYSIFLVTVCIRSTVYSIFHLQQTQLLAELSRQEPTDHNRTEAKQNGQQEATTQPGLYTEISIQKEAVFFNRLFIILCLICN